MSAEDDSPNLSLDNLSFFAKTYSLPSINENLGQWDSAWEKTLLTLSACTGVLNDLPVVALESRCNFHDSRIVSGRQQSENEA
jgi:hypothetical protein